MRVTAILFPTIRRMKENIQSEKVDPVRDQAKEEEKGKALGNVAGLSYLMALSLKTGFFL